MNYSHFEFRTRNNPLDYCFQSKEAQLSYRLYQVQNSKQMIQDCIEAKKITISKQKQFNQKIQKVIQSKQSKLEQLQQKYNSLEQQLHFNEQYLHNLNNNLSQLKHKLDAQLKSCLYLTTQSSAVKLEHQGTNTLTLNDLMGGKCRFTPQVMNYSWQIDIQNNQEQLQICKTNDQPLYLFVYNYHPLPSKGTHHFSITVQYSYRPKFLLGVSNSKNKEESSQHIYLNSETMQIQNNGVEVSKVIGQINNSSKVKVVINCDVLFMFIVVDQVLLGRADLCSIKDKYLYLFIGLSCSDTTIKFDHS